MTFYNDIIWIMQRYHSMIYNRLIELSNCMSIIRSYVNSI